MSGTATLVLTWIVLGRAEAQQPATTSAALMFDGVTVVDVEQGKLVPNQRVLIVGRRITAVDEARKVRPPSGTQVVHAQGKYLIPGLWDLHTHPKRSTDVVYPLLLANGVTGIRDAFSDVPLDTLIRLRQEILAGTRLGPPRQVLSGMAITEAGHNGMPEVCTTSRYGCVASTPAAIRQRLDSLKAAGADMIKTYEMSRKVYFLIAAEARRIGIPFGGHLPKSVTAVEASDSGARIIDHPFSAKLDGVCWGDSATVERCRPVAERFRRNGTWFAPTLARTGGLERAKEKGRRRPLFALLHQRAKEFWAGTLLHGNWLSDSAHAGSPGSGGMDIIQKTGLPILASTDAGAPVLRTLPFGFALHAELGVYVAEGLTPLAALQSATLNPAQMLRGTDSLGTVAPGKLADLVLLDANPLADITNTTTIRAVVANGRYFDRAVLDGLLVEVQTKGPEER